MKNKTKTTATTTKGWTFFTCCFCPSSISSTRLERGRSALEPECLGEQSCSGVFQELAGSLVWQGRTSIKRMCTFCWDAARVHIYPVWRLSVCGVDSLLLPRVFSSSSSFLLWWEILILLLSRVSSRNIFQVLPNLKCVVWPLTWPETVNWLLAATFDLLVATAKFTMSSVSFDKSQKSDAPQTGQTEP